MRLLKLVEACGSAQSDLEETDSGDSVTSSRQR